MASCAADAYYQLQSLEPVAGIAVAVNLAYLALDRFRYSSIVQDTAVNGLGDESIHSDGRLQRTTPFKVLCLLAGDKAPPACQAALEGDDTPYGGFWFWVFRHLFRKGRDEKLGFVFTVWAYLAIFLGVASNAGVVKSAVEVWTQWVSPDFAIWSLFTITLGPVAFVLLGRGCSTWSEKQARAMAKELRDTAKYMAGAITKDAKPIPNTTASGRMPKTGGRKRAQIGDPT